MTPEGKVKAAIRRYLKTAPGCYSFTPIGSTFGKAGVPDVIICVHGRFIGVEVKASGRENTLTTLQAKARDDILAAGGLWVLATDVDAVRAVVHSIEA